MNARRRFFRSFLGEMASFVDEVRGTPQFRLDELDSLPAATLRAMQPVRIADAGDLDGVGQWVVERFDGRHSLDDIGDELSDTFDIDPGAAHQTVRAIFLTLAKAMICVPAGAPGETS